MDLILLILEERVIWALWVALLEMECKKFRNWNIQIVSTLCLLGKRYREIVRIMEREDFGNGSLFARVFMHLLIVFVLFWNNFARVLIFYNNFWFGFWFKLL